MADDQWSAAHQAIEDELVEALALMLAEGVEVDQADSYGGFTLLHHAIDVERDAAAQTGGPLTADMTRVILSYGPNLQLRDAEGRTPLDFALEIDHQLAVGLIREQLGQPFSPREP